jgi:regulatory protein
MTEQQALTKLTALCSGAEHCSYEMTEKMKRWELDEETQARIMEYLTREKYVDDSRFCRAFIREKMRFNKWGRRKIELALMQKRIDRSMASEALDEIDDSEYIAILRPMLKQKERSVTANSEYEKNMKLIKFAMSRGFTFNIIKECLTGDMDDVDDEM